MTKFRRIRFDCYAAALAVALITLTGGLSRESQAQIKPSLKIKLSVSPSINISKIDEGLQGVFTEELSHFKELIPGRKGGADSVSFGSGFSISSYENIAVILSFTVPEKVGKSNIRSSAARIRCGYLNDGTTYFRRARITDKSPLQFRLRNNSLLKRSMQFTNPQFVAYVFFMVIQRKELRRNGSPLPVSTVTVEFL